MPTPFQHLVYAELVERHPALPPAVRRLLRDAWGPYLLGSTAGDVQVMTQQRRVETHFYHLADIGVRPAVSALFAAHPHLARPAELPAAHAAFLTGYLVHLIWDEVWARDIFIPLYRDGSQWREPLDYHLHHNALRVLLDSDAYSALYGRVDLLAALRTVTPYGWLPFAPDQALLAWRDWLVAQLSDAARLQTALVFAERMHVPVEDLAALVEALRAGAYAQIPDWSACIERYVNCALEESVTTVLRYWGIADRLEPREKAQQASLEV